MSNSGSPGSKPSTRYYKSGTRYTRAEFETNCVLAAITVDISIAEGEGFTTPPSAATTIDDLINNTGHRPVPTTYRDIAAHLLNSPPGTRGYLTIETAPGTGQHTTDGQTVDGHVINVIHAVDGNVYFLDGQTGRPAHLPNNPTKVEYIPTTTTDSLATPTSTTTSSASILATPAAAPSAFTTNPNPAAPQPSTPTNPVPGKTLFGGLKKPVTSAARPGATSSTPAGTSTVDEATTLAGGGSPKTGDTRPLESDSDTELQPDLSRPRLSTSPGLRNDPDETDISSTSDRAAAVAGRPETSGTALSDPGANYRLDDPSDEPLMHIKFTDIQDVLPRQHPNASLGSTFADIKNNLNSKHPGILNDPVLDFQNASITIKADLMHVSTTYPHFATWLDSIVRVKKNLTRIDLQELRNEFFTEKSLERWSRERQTLDRADHQIRDTFSYSHYDAKFSPETVKNLAATLKTTPSIREKVDPLLSENFPGFFIGESHNEPNGWRFVRQNLQLFAADKNVTTIYLECLLRSDMQKYLDEYHNAPMGGSNDPHAVPPLPAPLQKYLEAYQAKVGLGKGDDTPIGVIKEAKRRNVRILAIDDKLSTTDDMAPEDTPEGRINRLGRMNTVAQSIISHDSGRHGKFVGIVGRAHTYTNRRSDVGGVENITAVLSGSSSSLSSDTSVPGIPQLLDVPAVKIEDHVDGQPTTISLLEDKPQNRRPDQRHPHPDPTTQTPATSTDPPTAAQNAARAKTLLDDSTILSAQNRHADALPAAETAFRRYEKLMAIDPSTYQPLTLRAFDAWMTALSGLGRDRKAAWTAKLIVDEFRDHASENAAFEHGLAHALSSYSALSSARGLHAPATAAGREAVTLYRKLAATDTAHQPGLAHALSTLSAVLTSQQQHTDALAAGEEAVKLYQQLPGADITTHRPHLLTTLVDSAAALTALGRHPEALNVLDQATGEMRQLPAGDRPPHQFAIARALGDIATTLTAQGSLNDAHAAKQQAAAMHQEIADRANTLLRESRSLSAEERHTDAAAKAHDVVALCRELANADPATYRPQLVPALNDYGIALSNLGQNTEALAATTEAITIIRDLATTNPHYRSHLILMLSNLAADLRTHNRFEDALNTTQEIVTICQQHINTDPATYQPELARAWQDTAANLSNLNRHTEALTAINQAVAQYQQLATTNPTEYQTLLNHASHTATRIRQRTQIHQSASATRVGDI